MNMRCETMRELSVTGLSLLVAAILLSPVRGETSPTRLLTKVYGTQDRDFIGRVATDRWGNVYGAGSTYGEFSGFTNAEHHDAFLARFDRAGNMLWVQQWGGEHRDQVLSVVTDACGNAYVAGETGWVASASESRKAFVGKFSPSGCRVWWREFKIQAGSRAIEVAVDSSGNTYAAGSVMRPQGGNAISFLRKYDWWGRELWTVTYGDQMLNQSVSTFAVDTDACGNVYVAGGANGRELNGTPLKGLVCAYVSKYDSSGSHVWTRTTNPRGHVARVRGIQVDDDGTVVIGGGTYSTKDCASLGPTFAPQSLEQDVTKKCQTITFAFLTEFSADGTQSGEWHSVLPRSITRLDAADSSAVYASGFGYAAKMSRAPLGLVWKQSRPFFTWGVSVDAAGDVYFGGDVLNGLDGEPAVGGPLDCFYVKYRDSSAPAAKPTAPLTARN